jgi:hypothetical protein
VGLLSDGPRLAAVEAALDDIVDQANDDGACRSRAELHAVDIFHQHGRWDRATIDQSIKVFDDTLALLTGHGIEVLARGANFARFHARYGENADPFTWEFSNLLERLNERCRSRGDYALVIGDQQSEHREILQRHLADSKKYGTGGYRNQILNRVLDTAHFVDSKLSRMIQLADMAAFVLRRRAGRSTERDPRLEAVMQRWSSLVYAAVPEPQGQYYTVR